MPEEQMTPEEFTTRLAGILAPEGTTVDRFASVVGLVAADRAEQQSVQAAKGPSGFDALSLNEHEIASMLVSAHEWIASWGEGPNWSDASGATIPASKTWLHNVLSLVERMRRERDAYKRLSVDAIELTEKTEAVLAEQSADQRKEDVALLRDLIREGSAVWNSHSCAWAAEALDRLASGPISDQTVRVVEPELVPLTGELKKLWEAATPPSELDKLVTKAGPGFRLAINQEKLKRIQSEIAEEMAVLTLSTTPSSDNNSQSGPYGQCEKWCGKCRSTFWYTGIEACPTCPK